MLSATRVCFDKQANSSSSRVEVGIESIEQACSDTPIESHAEKIAARDAAQNTPVLAAMLHGGPPTTQILFNTRVLPATDPHFRDTNFMTTPARDNAAQLKGPLYRTIVDLLVDPRGLDLASAPDGTRLDNVEFVLVAYDSEGPRVNYVDRPVQLSLDAGHYARVRASGFPLRVELDLPAGQFCLRLAVYDLSSGHNGSLEVPLSIAAK